MGSTFLAAARKLCVLNVLMPFFASVAPGPPFFLTASATLTMPYPGNYSRGRQYRPTQSAAVFHGAFGGFTDQVFRELGRRHVPGTNEATDEEALAAGRAFSDGIQGLNDERLHELDDESDTSVAAARGATPFSANTARTSNDARRDSISTPPDPRVQQAYDMLQSQSRGEKSSTEKKINPYHKYWKAFCVANGIMTENEQKQHLHFLNANKEPDMVKMRSFIQFLDGMENKLTAGQLGTACLFIQTYLNRQMAANDKTIIKGAVKNDPIIKEVLKGYQNSKATRALSEGEDFQSAIATRITKEQMYDMTKQGLNPTDESLKRLHTLSLMNTVAGVRHTHQTGQRGDDLRNFSAAMGFTQVCDYIGPNGTELNYVITNQGKTNKVGKHEYSAFAPHLNPMLDTTAWHGFIFMYRHSVMQEPVPNLLDWKDYYKRPVYRGSSGASVSLDSSSQNEHWNKLYASEDVQVAKVVHQGRVESQQHLDNVGVSQAHISRAHHYTDKSVSTAQATSYLYNPPLDAVVARAGGDPRNIRYFDPVWNKVPVSEELLSLAVPDLVTQIKAVEEEFSKMSTIGERKSKQLHTARGTANSFKSRVEHALRAAASRPLDVNTKLIVDSEPLYLKYRDSFPLFRHQVFSSSQFMDLVGAMRVAQDTQNNRRIQIPSDCANEFQRIIYDDVMPAMRMLQTDMSAGQRGMDAFRAEIRTEIRSQMDQLEQQQARFNRAIWDFASESQGIDPAQSDARFWEAMSGPSSRSSQASASLPQQQAGSSLAGRSALTVTGSTTLGLRADGITPRKRKPGVSRLCEYGSGPGEKQVLMSTENYTLEDFWGEFYHGRNGNEPLKDLEAKGIEWRRDPPGATRFKTFWSYRVPIYNLMMHWIDNGESERAALYKAQPIFDSVPKSRTGKPNLKKLPDIFNKELKRLGGYESRKYKRRRTE